MIFFIILGTLCIFLDVKVETTLIECLGSEKEDFIKNVTFPYGVVCTNIACDWSESFVCRKGTHSEVLKWETDIFEISFEAMELRRPREIVIIIELNDEYYIKINVISDKEKRTVKVMLNECSFKGELCLENRNFTHDEQNITFDTTCVAIGFRNDKKMNFATVSKGLGRATDLFGQKNEYDFKMSGFHFNTEETMKITVSTRYDRNFKYKGLAMQLPTSVGGMFFDENGYFFHDADFRCFNYYTNPNNKEGLAYIIREYFNNSENWRANQVEYTLAPTVPYFDENGMKVDSQDKMKVKVEKNPYFDETKMIRKGCLYVEKPVEHTEPAITETATTELTSTEEENTETTTATSKEDEVTETTTATSTEGETTETTTTTSKEDEVTETTKSDDLTEKSVSTLMPPPQRNEGPSEDSFPPVKSSLPEGEIEINNVILTPRLDHSEEKLDLKDLFKLAGKESFDPNWLNNFGKGGDDLTNVKLKNGSEINLEGYKLKNPPKKEEKKKDTKKKKGGSGGAGDASRGQKEVKNISPKYVVILILIILSI